MMDGENLRERQQTTNRHMTTLVFSGVCSVLFTVQSLQ